jgi:hypothetical protein
MPGDVVTGAMLYRAGPHEIYDIIAFCGPGNEAYRTSDGVLAHYWLTAGDQLIDFSVGDWRSDCRSENDVLNSSFDRRPDGSVAPAVQWTAPDLPDFWWQPAATLTAPWRPQGHGTGHAADQVRPLRVVPGTLHRL